MDVVRALQERAARAQPAEHVETVGGWWLRHVTGGAWWAGTVLPHGDPGPDGIAGRVAEAEKFYAGRGTVTRFQITPGVCPDGLDPFLAARGYRREFAMSLRTAPVAAVRAPAGSVRVDDHPTGAHRAMFGRIEGPAAYASAVVDGDVVAVGRAVADTGWVGVFGMVTVPRARGRGMARAVLAALAGWADGQGADRLYLQVERDNLPALRLYERAGFTEVAAYHYRVAE